MMENTELVLAPTPGSIQRGTVTDMATRLINMRQKIELVQSFFKEIMVPEQDYGIIEGTQRPTLKKSGAEKLCEFYGFCPQVEVNTEADRDTGFCRAQVKVTLRDRVSGILIAEGVGEANTLEGRYRWRWVNKQNLPSGIDPTHLRSQTKTRRDGTTYQMFRVENEDPWTLWNTVVKMAKKRAFVDATLSATRSSGIFTQDIEDLEKWAESGTLIEDEPMDSHDNNGNASSSAPSRTTERPSAGTSPSATRTGTGRQTKDPEKAESQATPKREPPKGESQPAKKEAAATSKPQESKPREKAPEHETASESKPSETQQGGAPGQPTEFTEPADEDPFADLGAEVEPHAVLRLLGKPVRKPSAKTKEVNTAFFSAACIESVGVSRAVVGNQYKCFTTPKNLSLMSIDTECSVGDVIEVTLDESFTAAPELLILKTYKKREGAAGKAA